MYIRDGLVVNREAKLLASLHHPNIAARPRFQTPWEIGTDYGVYPQGSKGNVQFS